MANLLSEATDTRYDIIKILGQGASATVYLARHRALGELRVLKILHQDMMMDTKRRQKFMLEAQVSAHLKHPAIVQVFDVTQTSSKLQIEMENIDGMSLRQHLERREFFPLPVTLALVFGILEGLEHAHRARLTIGDMTFDGVIHRDLKPENILIRKNGQPVICDFGVAKVGADLMTMTQHISGSVAYMAPERLRGELSTRSIDIFAMGVIFFELHTGKRPFSGANKTDALQNILRWKLIDLDSTWGDSDKSILEIIRRALARDPDQRYQDATQMLSALRPIYKLYHGDAPPLSIIHDFFTRGQFTTAEFRALVQEEPKWKRNALIGLSIAIVVLIAFIFFLSRPNEVAPGLPINSPATLSSVQTIAPTEASIPASGAKTSSTIASSPNSIPAALTEIDISKMPKENQQKAYFTLAKKVFKENGDAGRALLLVTKALDFSFHPTIALLKVEILINQNMANMASNELSRIKPWLSNLSPINQAQYHWLNAQMELQKDKTSPSAKKRIRSSLKSYLALAPQSDADNMQTAKKILANLP